VSTTGSESPYTDSSRENRYPPHIGALEFYVRASELEFRIRNLVREDRTLPFDGLLGIKRSGWVLGTFLSNRLDLPLFAKSEIGSIPPKFQNILVVDTVAWTGRSLRRALSHLRNANLKATHAAVLFANMKFKVGDEFKVIQGDSCIHVPVFFFNKGFMFGYAHDMDYADRALAIDNERAEHVGAIKCD
jgi:hypothetical protein